MNRTKLSTVALAAAVVDFICGALFCAVTPISAANVHYVRVDGDDAMDGSSWALARRTISVVTSVVQAGDTIQIAGGEYEGPVGVPTGITIVGGFDPATGAPNPDQTTVLERTDISGPVIVAASDVTISGVTISGGLTGVECNLAQGVSIANCRFVNQQTSGVNATASDVSVNSSVFEQCGTAIAFAQCTGAISNNQILLTDWDGVSLTDSEDVTVTGNTIRGSMYAGIYTNRGVRIEGNTISGCYGYGIATPASASGTLVVVRNTICGNTIGIRSEHVDAVGNVIARNGTGIRASSVTASGNTMVGHTYACIDSTKPQLSNNILAWNRFGVTSFSSLGHNVFYANWDSSVQDNKGWRETDYYGDPLFVNCDMGDYRLQPGSPCIDAAGPPSGEPQTVDIAGQPRTQGAGTDIGAYESDGAAHSTPTRLLYVAASSPPGGDGQSWSSAFHTINDAMEDVYANGPAEVRVASGVYNETVALQPFAYVRGGFAGDESPDAAPHPTTNSTVIQPSSLRAHGVYAASGAVLQGFKISAIDPTPGTTSASGILCRDTSPAIDACTISGWRIGVKSSLGSPQVTNSVIAENWEHGVRSYSKPALINDTIVDNANPFLISAPYDASYIDGFHYNVNPAFVNLILAFNDSTPSYGGSCTYSSNCVFSNGPEIPVFPSGYLNADPLFVDRASGDYHLTYASPCRNSGRWLIEGLPQMDIDGDHRILDGNPDMGADEAFGEHILPPPVMDPPNATSYFSPILVAIHGVTGSIVRYTTDSSDPTEYSPVAADGVVVRNPTTRLKARAFMDGWLPSNVTTGEFYFRSPPPALTLVQDAIDQGEGAKVRLTGLIVSATRSQGNGSVSAQQADRATGLQMDGPEATTASRGDVLDVVGTLTYVNGVWRLWMDDFRVLSSGPEPVPLVMLTREIALSDLDEDGLSELGLNPRCLLARIGGVVTAVDEAKGWVYVDDGSGLMDGSGPSGNQYVGLRIACRTLSLPPVGQAVAITGVVRKDTLTLSAPAIVNEVMKPQGTRLLAPALYPRTQADIQIQ
ncbi:MAG: right-handed parallel beta-helix repeat-containing protein [Armatimonadetes bacterium]|nr:right-handed parallel beta-helix repeat-containing protein [Armatimonadota bacterium]